jgi:Adenylosuccinate synthetase
MLSRLHRITDTVHIVNEAHEEGKRILIEGANATMLDLDFGTYPYVTSSNPSIGGVISGLGLAPQKLQTVIGVVRHPTPDSLHSAGRSQLHDEVSHFVMHSIEQPLGLMATEVQVAKQSSRGSSISSRSI